MEIVNRGNSRVGIVTVDSFAAARDRIEALLTALRCWDESNVPDQYMIYCIADLIGDLLPSVEAFEALDRYYSVNQKHPFGRMAE